ncbi:MAG: M3 family metallopeptidase [Sphingomonadales bacterium]
MKQLLLASAFLMATLAPMTTTEASDMSMETVENNALLQPWGGPFGGVPAFDKMNLDDLKEALEWGMAKQLEEIDVITASSEEPSFENTIAAFEDVGRDLDRVFAYYYLWSSNLSSPEYREIQAEFAPKISAYFTAIDQNEALFNRVKHVYDTRDQYDYTPEQQRLIWTRYNGFAHYGATLKGDAKKRYAEIQEELAKLHTKFANNVLADEENYVLYLNEDQLGGLPQNFINAAAAAAKARGHEGEYAITNTRSSMSPFLTYSTERDLREKVWRTYYNRGDNGDEFDNNAIIAQILKLRDERVKLLGYKNYASWRLADRMAKTPERADALMEAVWPAAVARVHEEVADMQALADAEGTNIKIAPWDYRYYAEKVRQDKYAFSGDEVKQYLQMDKLREAMFYVAGRLFNFAFTPIEDGSVPVFHEDVKVWEVTDKDSGEHIGLWYLDPFARKGKRSGAWATSYRTHETFRGKRTVLASNNSNFVKGAPGEPVLISWDDAETFFHEFGHALHALSSRVNYPSLNFGVRDYTEFQSQLLERWLLTDEVIDNYLVHHETGEPIPADLVAKIKAAKTFNQGFATTEYLASALVDMRYHTVDPTDIDPDAFERETLAELGMPDELVMRHRSTQFGHIFSGEGYSAGYYGYMWADVLTSDAAEAFKEAPGGFYDEGVAKKLVDHLFAPRNAIDPAEAYRAFRGRDANIEPLMRDRGFPVPAAASDGSGAQD